MCIYISPFPTTILGLPIEPGRAEGRDIQLKHQPMKLWSNSAPVFKRSRTGSVTRLYE